MRALDDTCNITASLAEVFIPRSAADVSGLGLDKVP